MKKYWIVIMTTFVTAFAQPAKFDSQKFYNIFDQYRLAPENLMLMRHDFIVETLERITENSKLLKMETVGHSVEERSINMVTFGTGKTRLLLWSQMHGDEPTATAALLAIFNYISQNESDPFIQLLKDNLTIYSIVMLNPDGAQNFQRRNAMGIDINRDARLLLTPEAKILKAVKDKSNPHFGFNLHDMGGRETVGESKELLSIALMAPPFNKDNEDSPSRIQAKKLAAVIKEALNPYIGKHIARYKADYMPRAFGDAMQNWGISTVLIESGMHQSEDIHYVERMNFIGLFAAFDAIATGRIERADAGIYDQIPLEGIEVFDILIKQATIFNGDKTPVFRADIGINRSAKVNGNQIEYKGTIEDLGDLDITTGLEIIEGENLIVTPGFVIQADVKYSVQELLQKGVTTCIMNEFDSTLTRDELQYFSENVPVNFNKIVSGICESKDIPLYTSLATAKIKMRDRGFIRKDLLADVLVFSQKDTSRLDLSNLKYVIKNGKIVYQKQ